MPPDIKKMMVEKLLKELKEFTDRSSAYQKYLSDGNRTGELISDEEYKNQKRFCWKRNISSKNGFMYQG